MRNWILDFNYRTIKINRSDVLKILRWDKLFNRTIIQIDRISQVILNSLLPHINNKLYFFDKNIQINFTVLIKLNL